MNQTNWKLWLVILVLLVGGAFELLKRMPGQQFTAEAIWEEGYRMATNALSPYSIRGQARPKTPAIAPAKVHVAAKTISPEQLEQFVAQNTPQATDFDHGKDKGAEGKVKNTKDKKKKKKKSDDKEKIGEDDDYEYFYDAKTGKKYRRKKTKKVDVVDSSRSAHANSDDGDNRSDESDAPTTAGLLNAALNQGELPPNTAQDEKEKNPFASLEEWIQRLLTRPDPAATQEFIQAYLDRLVSADIYYKIVNMMIEDARVEMRELGVLCAGMTPSVLSFNILAKLHQSEAAGSTVRTAVDGFLDKYAELANLNHLERVLKSPAESTNTLLALEKLELSMNKWLVPGTLQRVLPQFKRFQLVLDGLTKGGDAPVAERAKKLAADLQARINPATNTGGGEPTTADQTTGESPDQQASTQPF